MSGTRALYSRVRGERDWRLRQSCFIYLLVMMIGEIGCEYFVPTSEYFVTKRYFSPFFFLSYTISALGTKYSLLVTKYSLLVTKYSLVGTKYSQPN